MGKRSSDKKPSCSCGSGKRFMQCCYVSSKPSLNGHAESSQNITDFIDMFKEFIDGSFHIIDVSNDVTSEDYYKKHQLKHFTDKTVMVAEKNDKNALVFKSRINNESSDFMLMYHGGYRTFEYDKVDQYLNSLTSWIV